MSDQRIDQAKQYEMFIDYLKYLTTLNTGAVVISAAFLNELPSRSTVMQLPGGFQVITEYGAIFTIIVFGISLFLLSISTICSAYALRLTVLGIMKEYSTIDSRTQSFAKWSFRTLIFGVLSLALYAFLSIIPFRLVERSLVTNGASGVTG